MGKKKRRSPHRDTASADPDAHKASGNGHSDAENTSTRSTPSPASSAAVPAEPAASAASAAAAQPADPQQSQPDSRTLPGLHVTTSRPPSPHQQLSYVAVAAVPANRPVTSAAATAHTLAAPTRFGRLSAVAVGVHKRLPTQLLLQEGQRSWSSLVSAERIRSKDGPTPLVRLTFLDEKQHAAALQRGLVIFGQLVRIEPSRSEPTRPCRRCCQFGHLAETCSAPPRCHYCGANCLTDACTLHDLRHRRRYCASCNGSGHFTGQARCPAFPKRRNLESQQPTTPAQQHQLLVSRPPPASTQPAPLRTANPAASPATRDSRIHAADFNRRLDALEETTHSIADTVSKMATTLNSLESLFVDLHNYTTTNAAAAQITTKQTGHLSQNFTKLKQTIRKKFAAQQRQLQHHTIGFRAAAKFLQQLHSTVLDLDVEEDHEILASLQRKLERIEATQQQQLQLQQPQPDANTTDVSLYIPHIYQSLSEIREAQNELANQLATPASTPPAAYYETRSRRR